MTKAIFGLCATSPTSIESQYDTHFIKEDVAVNKPWKEHLGNFLNCACAANERSLGNITKKAIDE